MRWLFWGSVCLVTLVTVCPAARIEANSADARPCAACAGSQNGLLEDGGLRSSIRGQPYCTNPAPCHDKAWAGYCQEKSRAQAFWSHIGSSSPLGCRIACRLEMLMAPWRWPSECTTARSTGNWADQYQQHQAVPAPDADAAKPEATPEAQPKLPDPPKPENKPEKQSRWKQALSGLFR